MCNPSQAFASADLSAGMSSFHSVHPRGPSNIILTPEKGTEQGSGTESLAEMVAAGEDLSLL